MLVGQLLIPNPEVKNSRWQEWGMLVSILFCEIWSVTTWVLLPYNIASLWEPLHFLSGKSAKSKHLCLPRTLAMPLGGFVSWPCSFVGKFWSPYKTCKLTQLAGISPLSIGNMYIYIYIYIFIQRVHFPASYVSLPDCKHSSIQAQWAFGSSLQLGKWLLWHTALFIFVDPMSCHAIPQLKGRYPSLFYGVVILESRETSGRNRYGRVRSGLRSWLCNFMHLFGPYLDLQRHWSIIVNKRYMKRLVTCSGPTKLGSECLQALRFRMML